MQTLFLLSVKEDVEDFGRVGKVIADVAYKAAALYSRRSDRVGGEKESYPQTFQSPAPERCIIKKTFPGCVISCPEQEV